MSRFFSERHAALVPYPPGEQPQIPIVAKLNTNESPSPPSEGVARAIVGEIPRLQLYGPVTKEVPASIYQLTKGTIYVSEEMARPIEPLDYYAF